MVLPGVMLAGLPLAKTADERGAGQRAGQAQDILGVYW